MRKVLFILGELNDADVEWLSNAGERRKIAAGSVVIQEDTLLDTVYLILEGQMSVWAAAVKLATLGSGDILGEMSLIDSGKTSAFVRSDTDTVVLAIPKTALTERLKNDTGFAARFYKAIALFLADRMRNTVRRMGYDGLEEEPEEDLDFDNVDTEALNNIRLAGARFERILRQLSG